MMIFRAIPSLMLFASLILFAPFQRAFGDSPQRPLLSSPAFSSAPDASALRSADASALRHWYLHKFRLCESHRREPVDYSSPAYRTQTKLLNPTGGSRWIVQAQPARPTTEQRSGLNNPPAPAGGIQRIFPVFGRSGLNDPPAPAGGIWLELDIICVDTNAASVWHPQTFPQRRAITPHPLASDELRPKIPSTGSR